MGGLKKTLNYIETFGSIPTRRKIAIVIVFANILYFSTLLNKIAFLGLNKVIQLGKLPITGWGILLTIFNILVIWWIKKGRLA